MSGSTGRFRWGDCVNSRARNKTLLTSQGHGSCEFLSKGKVELSALPLLCGTRCSLNMGAIFAVGRGTSTWLQGINLCMWSDLNPHVTLYNGDLVVEYAIQGTFLCGH